MEKSLRKTIKDHILATKGSVTSKNFEEGKEEKEKPEARSRERSIHDFAVSTASVQNIDGIMTVKFEMFSSGK